MIAVRELMKVNSVKGNKYHIELNTESDDVDKSDNRHYRTYGARPKTGGDLKSLIARIGPKAVSQGHGQTVPLVRSPAQHAADLPTHGVGAEHPAARKHRALATIRALAARREMADRGMETDRVSEAYRDAGLAGGLGCAPGTSTPG
jgi:hypothetical protein